MMRMRRHPGERVAWRQTSIRAFGPSRAIRAASDPTMPSVRADRAVCQGLATIVPGQWQARPRGNAGNHGETHIIDSVSYSFHVVLSGSNPTLSETILSFVFNYLAWPRGFCTGIGGQHRQVLPPKSSLRFAKTGAIGPRGFSDRPGGWPKDPRRPNE
jgi:hypothetical protein